MEAGVPVLEDKIARQRPEAVGIVGKSIWETIWKVKNGRKMTKEEFRYGWQDKSENMGRVKSSVRGDNNSDLSGEEMEAWDGARVFVATTTSGLAATMRPAEKEAIWKELGDWVVAKRNERGIQAPDVSVVGTGGPPPE